MDNSGTILNLLLNHLPQAIFWKDKNLIFQGCNLAFAQQFGLDSIEQVIGKSDYDFNFSPSLIEQYHKDDRDVINTGLPKINYEEIQHQPDGSQKVLLVSKIPFYVNENITGLLGIYSDISDLKRREVELVKAKEKADLANEAKTEFLENMRHDIRTPLTGIVGFSDLLKMESDNPLVQEYADNLVASSHALLDLLDEVLEAVRVSSGEIPQTKKKFNLAQSLQHVIELNRAKAAQKQLCLSLNVDPTLPQFVIGDKVRVHRIALELIANALNFTDSGFVTLSVNLAKSMDNQLVVKLMVDDSGIGIPKEKQEDIYVQFKRLSPSYQGIYKGVGLGLSVVKQFIDELNGEIYVKSEPRRGTTFTCLIPLQKPLLDDASGIDEAIDKIADAPYETTYAQTIKSTQKTQESPDFRVLIVEDNPIAQTVAKSILTKLRCEADCAETGKKAIDLWKANLYDLVLMDIGLPDWDGYEVTRQIRVHELTHSTHIPIIALTAHAGDDNKKRCIEAGMNAVLTKPLTPKSCKDILDAFIPGYQEPTQSTPEQAVYRSDLPTDNDALFDLSSYPVLDIDAGVQTLGSEEALAEMLHFMVNESLPADLTLMQKAHDALNWDKTQQMAHKIKGGCVYVGTVKMKMACQYFERYFKSGQSEQLEPLYQQAIAIINKSKADLNGWLKSR